MSLRGPISYERSCADSEWMVAYRILRHINEDTIPKSTEGSGIIHFKRMFAAANGPIEKDYYRARDQLERWFPGEGAQIAHVLDTFFSRYVSSYQAFKKPPPPQPFFYNSALEREEVLEAMQKLHDKMMELNEPFVINQPSRHGRPCH